MARHGRHYNYLTPFFVQKKYIFSLNGLSLFVCHCIALVYTKSCWNSHTRRLTLSAVHTHAGSLQHWMWLSQCHTHGYVHAHEPAIQIFGLHVQFSIQLTHSRILSRFCSTQHTRSLALCHCRSHSYILSVFPCSRFNEKTQSHWQKRWRYYCVRTYKSYFSLYNTDPKQNRHKFIHIDIFEITQTHTHAYSHHFQTIRKLDIHKKGWERKRERERASESPISNTYWIQRHEILLFFQTIEISFFI